VAWVAGIAHLQCTIPPQPSAFLRGLSTSSRMHIQTSLH